MNNLTMYKNGFSKGLITGLILMAFAGRVTAQVSKVWVIGQEFVAKPDKWIGAKVGLFCISKPMYVWAATRISTGSGWISRMLFYKERRLNNNHYD
ncbi:hypothetical protein ACFJIV_05530 [Mucilaginibacter sp. UC70_90]